MPRSKKQLMSDKQEKLTAQEVGGKTTISSGNQFHDKGDVKSDNLLIECKITEQDHYPLHFKTWQKIAKEAARKAKTPVMRITTIKDDYAVLDELTVLANGIVDINGCFAQEVKVVGKIKPVFNSYKSGYKLWYGRAFSLYCITWEYFLDSAKELGWLTTHS